MILFSLSIFSQKVDNSVDRKAKLLLDQSAAKYNTNKGLNILVQVLVENEQTNVNKRFPGNILLKRNKFKMDLSNVTTFFDGKTEYVYLQKEKEVNISEPTNEELKDLNPLLLLKSYKSGYKIKYVGAKKLNGIPVEIVNLYPNDRKKNFSILTFTINSATKMPVSVRSQGKNGINTTINVKSYKYLSIPDTAFVFNAKKHSDVEVIDLR